ncbi:transmembrane protein 170A isoform X1 [Papio anubis]|uniref:transmembrane protein 170A isoform X1 n=2 Tax=Catarrhini TaxID=9526 RepID=UPI00083EFCDF|nr:transmembrane protein 170A isoform X1 [Papio anubis]
MGREKTNKTAGGEGPRKGTGPVWLRWSAVCCKVMGRPWMVMILESKSEEKMWYGVFLWALVSSLFFHVPAGLLALFTLRHHKYGRFMSVSILLMGIVGPITAGILTSAAIAGVYRAAGKEMIPFEALTLGTGQTFCVVVVSFLRILATL